MLTPTDIFFAAQLAAFAFVFNQILIEPDKIFGFYGDFLYQVEKAGYKWISDPLGGCLSCFSGQIALWLWLVKNWQMTSSLQVFFKLVLFISTTILIANIYQKICKN